MEQFVFLVERFAPALYIAAGLGVLLGLRSLYIARRSLASAQFELEKEMAQYRLTNAITIVGGLVEIALVIVALSQIVAPTLRAQPPQQMVALPENEETPFVTAAPNAMLDTGEDSLNFSESEDIPGLEDDLNLGPLATPTLTPTPIGTIIPEVPPATGCDTQDAILNVPVNGLVIFEAINVMGTANTTDFAFYRFELNGPTTNNTWASLAEYTVPVENGELGQIVPALLTPGEHRFRLSVFDITSTRRASCTMTVIISDPIPTATPIFES